MLSFLLPAGLAGANLPAGLHPETERSGRLLAVGGCYT